MLYMNYKKKTLMQRAIEAEGKRVKQNQKYKELSEFKVTCPFCKSITNLFLINRHLKKSIKSHKLKESWRLTQDNPQKAEALILIQLNDFKIMQRDEKLECKYNNTIE